MNRPAALTHGAPVAPQLLTTVRHLTGQFEEQAKLLRGFWEDWKVYSKFDQLSLAVPDSLYAPHSMSYAKRLQYGCGSLTMLGRAEEDKDFVHLVTGAEFIEPIFDYIRGLGYAPSRPMLRCLQPKQCLSLHRDTSGVRFHLVIDTHLEAFFVVNNEVHRMVQEGHLYMLNTSVLHTAVNAHLTKPRLHLTISGYKETP